MFAPSITRDELHKLPAGQFNGHIHLIEDISHINDICKGLAKETILGFDTETKPSFKKGNSNKVSLLQLATSDDAYLFRLNKTGLPKTLIKILSDPAILKVGIAIRDDIRHLTSVCDFKADGFIELQNYVKQFGIENSGLLKLSGIILKFRNSKSQQLSNWENEVLTDAQKLYAATDAWAACQIYKTLIQLQSQISND